MDFDLLAKDALDSACSRLVPDVEAGGIAGDPELCIAAIIGFAGEGLRGTLGITTTETGLRRVARSFGAHVDPRQAEDSLGELANLLLGDIKRTFTSYAVSITLATPLVVRGRAIEICGRAGARWFETTSEEGADRLTVWLDAHVDDTLEVAAEPVENATIGSGDALLF